MSTKNNPGAFRCYEAALPDEHVFTILARDPAGPATLRFWASERERVGKTENPDDRDRIDDARRDALLMEDWREKNLDPMGDGSGPSWKLVRITDDEGGPIRAKPENVQYVPAERDGDEAVRLNVEWLTARTRDLVEGRMSREDYTRLIEIACQSPDRRRTTGLTKTEEADDSLIYRLEGAIHFLRDGRLPTPYDLYRAVKKDGDGEGWNYECIGLGLTDLEQAHARLLADPRRTLPPGSRVTVEKEDPPVVESDYSTRFHEEMTKPEERLYGKGSSRDVTEIDTPDMPPHRFAMFDKGKGWAYGRGLEINPAHIPAMLDRMEEDGYTLVAALGAQADKVGMIFQRGPRYSGLEIAHGFGAPAEVYHPRDGGRASEKSDRFLAGEPLDEIDRDPPVAETPERFVIEYAERDSDGNCVRHRVPLDSWPAWAEPCLDRGRGQMP